MDCKMNCTKHQSISVTAIGSHNCSRCEDRNLLPFLSLAFLTFNSVIAVCRAYNHRDFSMIGFVLFLYFGFMSLLACLKAFDRLPLHEESPKKSCLKVAIWVLSTALNVGLAIHFAPLLFPVAFFIILVLAMASSATSFYFFFIYRDRRTNATSNCSSDIKNDKSGYRVIISAIGSWVSLEIDLPLLWRTC
uniref:Uncharacterized protein n=1 Tax=Nelumbo nucifera TaxID=4432 RepID=A0A822YQF7_NELNU|nr:TPA_asm: hypothetical protein HUJ06_005430 [Nelumbo nucifera]